MHGESWNITSKYMCRPICSEGKQYNRAIDRKAQRLGPALNHRLEHITAVLYYEFATFVVVQMPPTSESVRLDGACTYCLRRWDGPRSSNADFRVRLVEPDRQWQRRQTYIV